ncbi:MAG: tRNA 5-hydroxyuridine modification protein YegQ [Pseudomonadota bacterium]|nr:tRNA 5-hydroxyuridine modification protein YegQ [Pseudomonadota bacterium]
MIQTERKVELLSPAGTLKSQHYAMAFGADAVYAGLPRYSLRVRNNDFDIENLSVGIEAAHAQGKRFFVAVNIMPHGSKLKTFLADMAKIVVLKPDALIMSDPGLIMLIRENWPEMPIHLSVQMNTVNAAAVKFWQGVGIERIILSRELSLAEVEEIRQQCPDIELEVFVHGSLCIAYSGRCLLSGYFNHRDPNQGSCTNSCRWDYKVAGEETEAGITQGSQDYQADNRHEKAQHVMLLEEFNRPGELMPIEEDEHGTYIMNSKDLRAVEHVTQLVEMGVDCLKIEGRTKSHYYAARTSQIYRQAINDALAGREFDPSLMGNLESLANRGYTDGFFVRHHSEELQRYHDNASTSQRQMFVGEVMQQNDDGTSLIDVKNKFLVGDSLELLTPTGNISFKLNEMQDKDGKPLEVAPGGGWKVRIPLPAEAGEYGLLVRDL